MPQALIHLGKHEDRILTIIKGKYGLKNKSQAINLIIDKFEQEFVEPELRPEYVEKLDRLEREKGIPFKDINELKKIIEE